MVVKEWQTPRIHAVLIQYRAYEPVPVTAETPNELATLCFMRRGKTNYQCQHVHTTGLTANTNNFFYLPEVQARYQLEKDERGECFKICLSPNYIHTLSDRFPGAFDSLSGNIIQKRPFELETPHFLTTLEMNRIIEQIGHCRTTGDMASLYFETKVRELLALQWQLPLTQQDSANGDFRRYHDELNQARNILEESYQNPPGIHALSLRVRLCETHLKSGFKLVFGTTVFSYLFNYRMELACRHLTDHSLSIAAVAEQVGYKNPSTFTTAFKRRFGLSPMEYRKHRRLWEPKNGQG